MSVQNLEERTAIGAGQPLEHMLSVFGISVRARVAKKLAVIGYIQTVVGAGIAITGYNIGQATERLNAIADTYISPGFPYFTAIVGVISGTLAFVLATGLVLAHRKYVKQSQPSVQVS